MKRRTEGKITGKKEGKKAEVNQSVGETVDCYLSFMFCFPAVRRTAPVTKAVVALKTLGLGMHRGPCH
jgi:hypothetical protein